MRIPRLHIPHIEPPHFSFMGVRSRADILALVLAVTMVAAVAVALFVST